jgi:uncharacterized protein YrrD
MLKLASVLKGYAIRASDGEIGTIADFLFDDRSWAIRWLVVETGTWLTGRKILLHPVALGTVDPERRELTVALTMAQVQGSPEFSQHEPVSAQMEHHLYDYYGWEPASMLDAFGGNPISARFSAPPLYLSAYKTTGDEELRNNDPHLRSGDELTGYHVLAGDGAFGKLDDLLIDDANWGLGSLVVETGSWWSGKQVLISPHVVKDISWTEREIRLDLGLDEAKAIPPWNSLDGVGPDYEKNAPDHHVRPGSH